MPKAGNLESVRVFFDRVLNAGDLESLESFSHRDVAVPQSSPGIESFRRLLVEMRGAFANPEYKVVDSVCEGEKVVVRFSAKVTHAGRYLGLPATGRALNLWGVMMFRFEAGAIAEYWSLVDSQGILRQLRER
ncbi:MAG TPA: ester cyclase [Nitrososphaerales archaeon]|nr:ester cyclase [Nitrososphaerales archaeon]